MRRILEVCAVALISTSCATTRIEFSDPCMSMSANTELWIVANEFGPVLSSKLVDRVGNNSRLKRFGEVALEYWWGTGMTFYSHEVGHQIIDALEGYDQCIGFDLTDLQKNLFPDFYDHAHPYAPDDDPEYINIAMSPETKLRLFWGALCGLNQEERNVKTMWTRAVLDKALPRHQGLMLFSAKISDLVYISYDGFSNPRFDAENRYYSAPELSDYLNENGLGSDDLFKYFVYMESENRHTTREEMFAHFALADAASYALWFVASRSLTYIRTGNNNFSIPTFGVGGVRVAPPLWSSFMTPEGFFHDISTFVGVGSKCPVEISIGFPLTLGDDGTLECRRYGARAFVGNNAKISFSPFVYVCDWDSNPGSTFGLEVSVALRSGRIWFRHQHSVDDILENGVYRVPNGNNFVFGLEFRK